MSTSAMVLRSKRRVLADISNNIDQGASREVKATKKPKLVQAAGNLNNFQQGQPSSETVVADDNTTEEILVASQEMICFGFEHPARVDRSCPLPIRDASPAHCLEVLDDLYGFLRQSQLDALESVKDPILAIEFRPRALNWLLALHNHYFFSPASLWLTVSLFDRYLAWNPTETYSKLRLIASSALSIACKFDESRGPSMESLARSASRVSRRENSDANAPTYNKSDLIAIEFDILRVVDYKLLVPTPYHFIQRYCECIEATDRVRLLALYFAECGLLDSQHLSFSPSLYAAGALYAAMRSDLFDRGESEEQGQGVWSRALVKESFVEADEAQNCAHILLLCAAMQVSDECKLTAVYNKYIDERFLSVSLIRLPDSFLNSAQRENEQPVGFSIY